MADDLCEEIFVIILHNLPVETLLRCTTVCKSWYFLITSPQFISSQLNLAKIKTPSLLLRRCRKISERYDLFLDDDSFTPHSNLQFPFRSINSFFTIVGSCNGLFCLSDDRLYRTHTIILWNPCIKKSVLLPKPDPTYNSYGTSAQSLGFGFDPFANDYKVVRITYADCFDQPRVELYKLSTGVWHDLSFLALKSVIYSKSRQAFVSGATHWVARHVNFYECVLFFDMHNDVFGEMILPFSLVNNNNANNLMGSKELMVYNESLALIMWNVSGAEPSFCVWVMKEYGVQESWTKHLSFDLHVLGERFVRPLWVRKQDEVILVRQDGCLISYDPDGEEEEDHEVKDLGVVTSRSEEYRRSIHVDSYMESLVLLEKGLYSSDTLTCEKLPTLYASDCDSVSSCGSDYEHSSESDANVEVIGRNVIYHLYCHRSGKPFEMLRLSRLKI